MTGDDVGVTRPVVLVTEDDAVENDAVENDAAMDDAAVEGPAKRLRAEMVAGLVRRGELDERWRPAMEAVARHRFVPDTVWELHRGVDGPDLLPRARGDDEAAWLRLAYANAPVNTQIDDGQAGVWGRGREVTSSASQPGVVAQMLTALGVEPGMRVLEIGTGTGWNAALLAHRLGASNVVSVEIDAILVDAARARLAAAGFGGVEVLVADAAAEVLPCGFDRVLATVAAREVPFGWMRAARAGGVVVVPWGSDWYPSALLRLTVTDTPGGRVGVGRIVGGANFMVLRSQRRPRWEIADVLAREVDLAVTETELHPWHVATDPDAATAVGLHLPGLEQFYSDRTGRPDRRDGDPAGVLVVVDRGSGSWARVEIGDAAQYRVEQSGARRLWDEVTAAHGWWVEQGRPVRERWQVTVGADGQRVELG